MPNIFAVTKTLNNSTLWMCTTTETAETQQIEHSYFFISFMCFHRRKSYYTLSLVWSVVNICLERYVIILRSSWRLRWSSCEPDQAHLLGCSLRHTLWRSRIYHQMWSIPIFRPFVWPQNLKQSNTNCWILFWSGLLTSMITKGADAFDVPIFNTVKARWQKRLY